MPDQAILLEVSVGCPEPFYRPGPAGAPGEMVRSAIRKRSTWNPVWLGRTNLAGDAQGDTEHHGGPDKAVLAYAADHYAGWRHELNRPDLEFGAFGENFTIRGQGETSVCIGDIYEVGQAH